MSLNLGKGHLARVSSSGVDRERIGERDWLGFSLQRIVAARRP
jgi:hypothetical protein